MRCKHLFCNTLKALLVGSLNARDWGQSFDETTVLVLNTVGGILTDLVNKRDRFYGRSCLEENHYIGQAEAFCRR